MGFIQNDDTVLVEKGIYQYVPQQAAISHIPDGSILKGLISHSAVILDYYFKLNTSTQITFAQNIHEDCITSFCDHISLAQCSKELME